MATIFGMGPRVLRNPERGGVNGNGPGRANTPVTRSIQALAETAAKRAGESLGDCAPSMFAAPGSGTTSKPDISKYDRPPSSQ